MPWQSQGGYKICFKARIQCHSNFMKNLKQLQYTRFPSLEPMLEMINLFTDVIDQLSGNKVFLEFRYDW